MAENFASAEPEEALPVSLRLNSLSTGTHKYVNSLLVHETVDLSNGQRWHLVNINIA